MVNVEDNNLLKPIRQKELMKLLKIDNMMSIFDLSQKLNSSMMTIRRDLDNLEKTGIVKKVHGGALLIKNEIQPPFYDRVEELNNEKDRIGRKAGELVVSGAIVFFDAGTTPLAVIEYIPDDIEFTAITTGLMTAVALCNKPRANVICVGGNIHHSSYSSMSYISVDQIKKFNADIAFISTKAISIPYGTYEAQLQLIEVKRAIVEVSNKIVLLADHSKFETNSLSLSIALDKINLIITDNQTNVIDIEKLRKLGKDVILV